ncbi:Detected protein of unknown function [Hibiscus syriacus]|uniref:Uncharacterized protein n=1 Tax=Hibiscus syriacus TaxID=106335 RepID=A0A6A2X3S9_HIBSY|nr:Detected protein of unknown function [Hibiscus syriacus]
MAISAASTQLHSRLDLQSSSENQCVHQCKNGRIFTPSCLAKAAVSDVQLQNSSLTADAADNTLSEFARNVSVPEAYREWEVKVYDWQTHIDDRNIGGVDHEVSAFAYHSSGSYTAVWPVADNGLLELEHCLINPQDRESRVRIIQVVRVDGTKFVLWSIRVFCEQRYGHLGMVISSVDVLFVILHLP